MQLNVRPDEWIEVSNALWPRLQAAIVGDMTAEEALNEAYDEALIVMEDAGYPMCRRAATFTASMTNTISTTAIVTLAAFSYWNDRIR